ncbi:MAG: hypothetical protein D6691_09865 [Candidatus Hydrogenedentota bacterium]|nr:MAG: hypothetical protein D6691_09865 [Candidatus Hydrogenedentota bacterium]
MVAATRYGKKGASREEREGARNVPHPKPRKTRRENKRSKGNTSEIRSVGILATQYFSQPRVRLFLPLTSVKKRFRRCKPTIQAQEKERKTCPLVRP